MDVPLKWSIQYIGFRKTLTPAPMLHVLDQYVYACIEYAWYVTYNMFIYDYIRTCMCACVCVYSFLVIGLCIIT